MKAFQYVNPANEREAVAALGTERNRILPMAGGMDLLGLMKDYIVSPERVVNLKGLDGTITADGSRHGGRPAASAPQPRSPTSPSTPTSGGSTRR